MKKSQFVKTLGLIGCLLLPISTSAKPNGEANFGYRKSTNTSEICVGATYGTESKKGGIYQMYGGLGLMQQSNLLKKSDWFFSQYLGGEALPIANRTMHLGAGLELKHYGFNKMGRIILRNDDGHVITYDTTNVNDKTSGWQINPSLVFTVMINDKFGVKMNLGSAFTFYQTLNKEKCETDKPQLFTGIQGYIDF